MRRRALPLRSIALLLTLTAPAPVWPAEGVPARRPMTAEDLWAMDRVGEPAVSPDGLRVAFTVTRYSVEENRGNGDLWVIAADGSGTPSRLTWNEGSDGSPAWSPEGDRLAFVSKRGDAPPQIYLLPLAGGEAERVTDLPMAAGEPRWFPGGRRLAFLALTWPDLNDDLEAVKKRLDERKEDKTQARLSENRLLRFWDEWKTDGRAAHLFMVDLASRKVTDLTPGSRRLLGLQDLGEWDLSPDGLEAAISANSTDPPYPTLNYDLYLLPLDADGKPGELRNATAGNPADDTDPRYSPDGRYLLFGRHRRPDVDPDFVRLARYDRASGEVAGLTDAWDGEPGDWEVSPDGSTVFFHAEEKGRVNLYRMPIAGGSPEIVARGGTTAGVAVAPAAAAGGAAPSGSRTLRLVFRRDSITQPGELFALDLAGGEPRALTSFNAARLAGLDLGAVGEATVAGAEGHPLHMLLAFPPGFDPARKWPLLQVIHGGPHGASLDQFHYRWNAALFAARGHVVAMVNFHGSTGYGQAFAESILGNHGDRPFADVMAATDHLLAQGYVDAGRMAAAGGSYGGYLVAWILGHTDRFAALVDHAGVYDLRGQFASDSTWGRPTNYGAAPWTDPERVDRYSPSRYAPHFKTPTLVLHGEKDYRVPYTQGVNLYGVLQGKGVPSRIVIFPEENHWVLKPQAALLWWKEVFAWLDRWAPGGGR
jgi:dipeptidyl aminopeptidase/acylaminoacyl peptidase